MNSFDNLNNRVNLEYTLNESEELEEILEDTNLTDEYKDSLREAAKNIITAEFLVESNPQATEEDHKFVQDSRNTYEQVKDSLAEE